MAESEVESRETREADPSNIERKINNNNKNSKQLKKNKNNKGKKKNMKGKNKNMKGKKKNMKGKKKNMNGKKKSSKKKNKSSKEKKKSRKGKSKSKKNKKNKSKGKKSGKDKKNKTSRTSNLRQSCTSDDECLTAASKYMKTVEGKVSSFKAQKTRSEKFEKLTSNKGTKKDEFKIILSKLKEAGGGNATAMQCGGSTTSPAAQRLQALVNDLTKCEDNIKNNCATLLPTYNKTEAEKCSTDMDAFSSEVDKCVSGGGCTCWKANTLVAALAKIAKCDFTSTNNAFAQFKKNCTEAFGACRQLQDAAGQAINNCKTNAADVKAKLDAATKNKESLTALKAKVTALATASKNNRMQRQLFRALSCSDFITSFKKAIEMATQAPTSSQVSESITALAAQAPTGGCSAEEKNKLTAANKDLDSAITALDGVLEVLKKDYTGKILLNGSMSLSKYCLHYKI